jgi:hypothetical protein
LIGSLLKDVVQGLRANGGHGGGRVKISQKLRWQGVENVADTSGNSQHSGRGWNNNLRPMACCGIVAADHNDY